MDSAAGRSDGIDGNNSLENTGEFVINVECYGGGGSDVGGSGCAEKDEKICRVCHMSSDCASESGDLIQLGCQCRNDLGTAHRNCAGLWFAMKGNSCSKSCPMVEHANFRPKGKNDKNAMVVIYQPPYSKWLTTWFYAAREVFGGQLMDVSKMKQPNLASISSVYIVAFASFLFFGSHTCFYF